MVEVFSAQGKDPVAKWKLSGQPSISKVGTLCLLRVIFISSDSRKFTFLTQRNSAGANISHYVQNA